VLQGEQDLSPVSLAVDRRQVSEFTLCTPTRTMMQPASANQRAMSRLIVCGCV
jgi:hypothetical protein